MIKNITKWNAIQEIYCNNCACENVCFQEGAYGTYNKDKTDCKAQLQFMNKKEIKRQLSFL